MGSQLLRRRFQFSLRTALLVMLAIGMAMGIVTTWIRYTRNEAGRRKHDSMIQRLVASHRDGFVAWDFSDEHMLAAVSATGSTLAEDAFNYCLEEGSTQRIVDELIKHADDKELTIELCNVQLLIILTNARFSDELRESFRVSEFRQAYRDGHFQRVIATFGDFYIGEKIRRLFNSPPSLTMNATSSKNM